MSRAEVLRKAKALIEERGWHQFGWRGDDGCLCAGAAMLYAETGSYFGALEDVAGYHEMLVASGASPGLLVRWNDSPGRTKDEVLAAFDKAIALAEASS